ncbi:MAG: amidohydrolase family protein [Gammaproteobacteria bacterium]
MTKNFERSAQVAAIRTQAGHPIVDADGHLVEIFPLVEERIRAVAGADVAAKFAPMEAQFLGSREMVRWHRGQPRAEPLAGFWGFPTRNTLDRVTAILPELMYRRLDELGIDFALVYPTVGLMVNAVPDAELRCALARALNQYYAQMYEGLRDRMEPVAVIPTITPGEAVAELDHAVGTLGLKAVVLNGAIVRTTPAADGTPMRWLDTLGHASLYDYDPLWQRCQDLGVVPSFHATGFGWGSRISPNNYVHNHIGHFAAAQEATCRSLVFGGVPKRFPKLRFAFLEGGVAWGCQLYADILGHWDKRNREAVYNYSPAELDVDAYERLLREHARPQVTAHIPALRANALRNAEDTRRYFRPELIDDFAEARIESPADVADIFARQFSFGCEADDPLAAVAFDAALNPHGIRLNAMFASDIGHWDVPDMREVLPEAWELVEHGHMDARDFEDFACGNVVRMLTAMNPRFFDGTAVAGLGSRYP